MKNEEISEIIRHTEDYWSKMNEKAIRSEMAAIIKEYKEENNIETLTDEEFTDIFGLDTLYPRYHKPLSKWLDSYPWTVWEWQELYYSDDIHQIAITNDESDYMEDEELSENDQMNDLMDENNDELIWKYYNSSSQIIGNELSERDMINAVHNKMNSQIDDVIMSVNTEMDYVDYNEIMTEISNDFWSDGQCYDRYTEWLEQIERERSETFSKINAKGHRQDLSPSEIDAIVGLAGQQYLAETIDIKLGDAILSMLRVVYFFKLKMMHQVKWYNKHQDRVDQETERFKKEQNLTFWSDEVEWIKKNGPINYVICIQDLMLQVLFTMNGSHYRTRDRDYEWEVEFDKIFVEMPYGPEFDRVIINFLLLPLYHSTHPSR